MKFNFNKKISLFIALAFIIVISLLYYMREHKFVVNANTNIAIEFNSTDIVLSGDEENEFKNILNSIKVHRSLSRYDGSYHNESTIFIRIHDTDKNGTIRGILTVCVDDTSKSSFLGSKPNGRFELKKTDIQKIMDFLYPIIISLDT